MTAALPSGPPPSSSLPAAPADAAAALGRLSATGVALLDAGRPDEAVDVLRHAVAAGEPGADDLLARAYLDSGDWTRRPSCWAGSSRTGTSVRRAAGRRLGPDRRHRPRRGGVPARRGARRAGGGQRPRDPAHPGDRFDEAVPCSGAPRTRRPAGGGEPGRAAVRGGRPARRAGDRGALRRRVAGPTRSSRWPTCGPRGPRGRGRGAVPAGHPAGRGAGAQRVRAFLLRCAATRRPRSGSSGTRRRDEPGWPYALGRFLIDDGRPTEARDVPRGRGGAGATTRPSGCSRRSTAWTRPTTDCARESPVAAASRHVRGRESARSPP